MPPIITVPGDSDTGNPRTVRLPALWLDGAWQRLGSERSHSTHPDTLQRWQWSEDMAPQSGHPRGAQQAGRSAGPGWRDQDSTPGRSAMATGGVFAGWPWRMSSTRPGAASVHGVWRPLPAAVWHQGPQIPPHPADCHHMASNGQSRATPEGTGEQKGAAGPLAGWPRVTEITHKSQKFLQTHPPRQRCTTQPKRTGRFPGWQVRGEQ